MSVTPLSPTVLIDTGLPGPDLDAFLFWLEIESLMPADLSEVSTRELRVLCNELYTALEADFPPYGAPENYAAVVTEIEKREVHAESRPQIHHNGW